MNSNLYSVSSEIFKKIIFTGFSHLQKAEEFVDLTLAADGSFCKVHRNLVALASPYLRDILRNLPGNSPVIYLNNVEGKILQYLIEYIYQGEVNIPVGLINEFKNVCKSLHIAGFDNPELTLVSTEPKKAKKRKLSESSSSAEENTRQHSDVASNFSNDFKLSTDNQNLISNIITNSYTKTYEATDGQLLTANNNENHYENEQITSHTDDNDNPDSVLATENSLLTTENTFTLKPSESQQYKILVNSSKVENVPVIEIYHELNAPNDPVNNIEFNLQDLITIPANPALLSQNESLGPQSQVVINDIVCDVEKKIPTINILRNDIIKRAGTEMMSQSTELPSILPNYIHNADNTEPVINILDTNQGNDEKSVENLKANLDDLKNMAQYSLTERGAIQLILNRFIYCCHGKSANKQRWRCIDYRRKSCPAIVDTRLDGSIIKRKGLHDHALHDKKIFQKHKANMIFETIELASQAINSKQKDGFKTISLEEIEDLDCVQD